MTARPSPPVCPKCGEPLKDEHIVAACAACLNAAYLAALHAREAEALVQNLNPKMDTAMGLRRLRHVVLRVERDRCYCGIRSPGPRRNWVVYYLESLPPGVCSDCLEAIEKVKHAALAAKE